MQGGIARYINHACQGNCESFTVPSLTGPRIVICSIRPIAAGEELCYDYKVRTGVHVPSVSPASCCKLGPACACQPT